MLKLVTMAVAAATLALIAGTPAMAAGKAKGGNCVLKAAEGTGGTEQAAKFQVDEALLQAVDWGAWSAWMATGKTPGYDFGPRKYKCKGGAGLGFTCRGQAKICKL